MGTIIGSLQLGKPVVIMPRKAQLGEHRNDHQLATAARFAERPGVRVATDEHELASALDDLVDGKIAPGQRISPYASEELLDAVRAFIRGE
jgi:UDP-N-acetylglucosamine transferase subunit ALG13